MKKPEAKTNTKKLKNNSSGKRFVSLRLAIILALVALLLICGSLVAIGGPAKVRSMYYGYVVRSAYHTEYEKLAPALGGLGLTEDKHVKSTCQNENIATDGVHVSNLLLCGVQTDNYIVVNDANRPRIIAAAKQLDQLEKQLGGRMYTNTGPTFYKYFSEITNGVDYNPDFGVTFVRNNYLCEVHMNVAYSKPKPPAYSIQFGCNAPRVTTDDVYLLPPGANPA